MEQKAARKFVQDNVYNAILKEMWRLNDLLAKGKPLSDIERAYYNKNYKLITVYYETRAEYWAGRKLE